MSVRMQLSRILIRELVDYQVIELREVIEDEAGHEPRTFPIVIGLPEAQAIERRLSGTPIRRPQTHDLLGNIIEAFGGELTKIEINDLSEHTFFATLHITRQDGQAIEVDSRPSDAIAIGIATGTPIWVAEHVLDAAIEPDMPPGFPDDESEGL